MVDIDKDQSLKMYEYESDFYRYINNGSVESARAIIPALLRKLPLPINTVLDVGCGAGAWLSVWKQAGRRITGLDGDYVDRSMLMIAEREFQPQDLAQPFVLTERFDLTQSLEVAEHLPASAAAQFVQSLCATSDIILFSAAAPGQGGENHINEQPYSYWQRLFEQQGYQMYDAVRDSIIGNRRVMPWYRYNTFLFVNSNVLPEVHAAMRGFRLESGQTPKDKSPKLYQLRKMLIRVLPVKYRTRIAILKKKFFTSRLRSVGSS